MKPDDVVVGLVTGCVLIALGLVPGLFDRLAERVQEGVRNFNDSMFSPFPGRPARGTEYQNVHRPFWLAGLGAALIALSVLGYIWQ